MVCFLLSFCVGPEDKWFWYLKNFVSMLGFEVCFPITKMTIMNILVY